MAVTSTEFTTTPYLDGEVFGNGGAYSLTHGLVYFGVDPLASANQRIVDLELADRDDVGLVNYDADFCLLSPADPSKANNKLCFVVNNRGRTAAVPFSSGTKQVPATEIDPGDGYLLRDGWTIAWCGWQWDMLDQPGLLGIRVPEARIDGASIAGQIRVDFRADAPILDHPLADIGALYAFQPYPAEDQFQPDAMLSVRDGPNAAREIIDRGRWHFAHDEDGRPVPDATSIWLEGGFEPHRLYEVLYRTNRSPVVGTGLLSTRDFVSHLRYGKPGATRPIAHDIDYAFGHGVSQTGRYLRHFVYEGLNVDEAGRPVFDGILPHIAGARRGEFNSRYAQPSHIGYSGVSVLPPYSIDEHPGLYDTQVDLGSVPKTIATNTSWEYWRSDACFNHIDPATNADRIEGANHRSYLFAGIDHLGESPAKADLPLANPPNPLSYTLLLRAAFSNLVEWVTHGVEPPASRIPRVSDHSAAMREEVLVAFATLPGAVLPDAKLLPVTRPTDFGAATSSGVAHWPPIEGPAFVTLVASIDIDGNEIVGIRLPEIAVPVATYTGWNPPAAETGRPHPLKEFAGSRFPFPKSQAQRLASNDPRASVEERYPIRAEYERLADVAVDQLIAHRLLLEADRLLALQAALSAYDEMVDC